MSGISQVAVVGVGGERAEAVLVGRGFSDGVQDFHVSDVVDEQGLLETDDQALKIGGNKYCSNEAGRVTISWKTLD